MQEVIVSNIADMVMKELPTLKATEYFTTLDIRLFNKKKSESINITNTFFHRKHPNYPVSLIGAFY